MPMCVWRLSLQRAISAIISWVSSNHSKTVRHPCTCNLLEFQADLFRCCWLCDITKWENLSKACHELGLLWPQLCHGIYWQLSQFVCFVFWLGFYGPFNTIIKVILSQSVNRLTLFLGRLRPQATLSAHNFANTINFLNIRTAKKFVVITLKFELCGSTID